MISTDYGRANIAFAETTRKKGLVVLKMSKKASSKTSETGTISNANTILSFYSLNSKNYTEPSTHDRASLKPHRLSKSAKKQRKIDLVNRKATLLIEKSVKNLGTFIEPTQKVRLLRTTKSSLNRSSSNSTKHNSGFKKKLNILPFPSFKPRSKSKKSKRPVSASKHFLTAQNYTRNNVSAFHPGFRHRGIQSQRYAIP